MYKIGNNVTLTQCRLLMHDACLTKQTGYVRVGTIEIGDNVFVGVDSIILCNTKIGSNVIIGAGSVVGHDIPNDSVVIGNPCRIICKYSELLKKEFLNINDNKIEKSDVILNNFLNANEYRYVLVNKEVKDKKW